MAKAYIGTVLSSDFRGVQIIATLNSDSTPPEVSRIYNDTLNIIETNLSKDKSLNYKIAGDPVLGEYGKIFMYADLKNLIPLITVVVLLCLFFSFKNIEGTILPLLTVLISTIWTAGRTSYDSFKLPSGFAYRCRFRLWDTHNKLLLPKFGKGTSYYKYKPPP